MASLGALGGCSSPAQPKTAGQTCFVVSDCADPLVCVPQSDGSRRCSSDTSSLVHLEDAGADAARPFPPSGTPGADDAATE